MKLHGTLQLATVLTAVSVTTGKAKHWIFNKTEFENLIQYLTSRLPVLQKYSSNIGYNHMSNCFQ